MRNKNKGFTLVELIIVVAIIAILASVLAPQYLKYVERTKESNDLQIATNLVKATTVAVADPKSNVPADTIIEVLWMTRVSNGEQFRGWLLVREAYSGSTGRLSDIKPSNYTQKGADVKALQEGIIGIMGYEALKNSGTNDWYAVIGDAESNVGMENVFCFHINSSTGEIANAYVPSDGTKNAWIDEIGVDIAPYSR